MAALSVGPAPCPSVVPVFVVLPHPVRIGAIELPWVAGRVVRRVASQIALLALKRRDATATVGCFPDQGRTA